MLPAYPNFTRQSYKSNSHSNADELTVRPLHRNSKSKGAANYNAHGNDFSPIY